MTREEREDAIKFFTEVSEKEVNNAKYSRLAIEALDPLPCEDCISRQAVDELSKELVHTTRDKADFLCNFWEGLQKLPPVTPKEKTGKWIDEGFYADGHSEHAYRCSECDEHYIGYVGEYKYCPNCGAKMQEVENEDSD